MINFEVVHDTCSQINTNLLQQAVDKNNVVFGKVVESHELLHIVSISHHIHILNSSPYASPYYHYFSLIKREWVKYQKFINLQYYFHASPTFQKYIPFTFPNIHYSMPLIPYIITHSS